MSTTSPTNFTVEPSKSKSDMSHMVAGNMERVSEGETVLLLDILGKAYGKGIIQKKKAGGRYLVLDLKDKIVKQLRRSDFRKGKSK